MTTKICSKCHQEKNITEFSKDKRNKDDRRYWCKKCCNKYNKKYVQKYPIKHWCHLTIVNHKNDGHEIHFKAEELLPLAKKSKNCFICDKELNWELGNKGNTKHNSPTLDRTSNDKILTLKNIQIICHHCNITKRDRTMKEMYQWCENFVNKFKEDK